MLTAEKKEWFKGDEKANEPSVVFRKISHLDELYGRYLQVVIILAHE